MSNTKSLVRNTVVASLCAMALAACSSGPAPKPQQESTDSHSISLDEERLRLSLLQADPVERLELAQKLANQQAWDSAQIAIEGTFIDQIPTSKQNSFLYLRALIAVNTKNGDEALYWLNYPLFPEPTKSEKQRLEFALLKAEALALEGQHVAAARERIFLSSLLSGEQYDINHQAIWFNLLEVPAENLKSLSQSNMPSELKGWANLAYVTKNNQSSIDGQISELKKWRKRHPQHPASIKLPEELKLLEQLADQRPTSIALLLPTSGSLAATGQALRDGFLAAHYYANSQGHTVPEIKVYDTNRADFLNLYQQVAFSDVDLIVGPLTKKHVSQLQAMKSLPVPTLALNYVEDVENPVKNLFQYGLAAEDEARQVARKAWQEGHKTMGVLLPKGQWGERVLDAFSQEWINLGGTIAETQVFGGNGDYSDRVRSLLNVDESEQRARDLRVLLRQSLEFNPRRREDVDAIFMAALPNQARQIKPTLEFHFAGDLPVYATSHIYSGRTSVRKDRDLDGVMFCDIPWLLDDSTPLKRLVTQNWSSAQSGYGRMYAMGVDAYQLSPRLQQLAAISQSRVYGQTGALELDKQRKIRRNLTWAIMENGRAQPLVAKEADS